MRWNNTKQERSKDTAEHTCRSDQPVSVTELRSCHPPIWEFLNANSWAHIAANSYDSWSSFDAFTSDSNITGSDKWKLKGYIDAKCSVPAGGGELM